VPSWYGDEPVVRSLGPVEEALRNQQLSASATSPAPLATASGFSGSHP
jgi:hypothetical protein